jgi:bifunctional enzyme CysN/CysC
MKGLLKFITCGSVDDGKSTLIGHMLYDAKLLFADHQKALELDSRLGSSGGGLDYSLLLDGLLAEREQGITIDVAYRFFTTEERSFIVADCPGHEQYTRNMAVGASFAELAVVLVDATKGVLPQTKRHLRICALMGIRHFVLALNKMDLVSYSRQVFQEISEEFTGLAYALGAESVIVIPVSATNGDNITKVSPRTPWYEGVSLLQYLETVDIAGGQAGEGNDFLMPVQRVCRPDRNFRGFQGQVERGQLAAGEEITVLPSGEKAIVKAVYHADKKVGRIANGQPVTVCLASEIDVSRGSVLAKYPPPPWTSRALTATLLWMDDDALVAGRHYLLKCGCKTLPATVMTIKHRIDINNGKHVTTDTLNKNELGECDISLAEKMVFTSLSENKALGGFILIDRVSNMTAACGVIKHSLRRSDNITWADTDVTPAMRASLKGQKPATIWFTGLSGAGKTVLANALERRLHALGKHTMILDGDNIRHGLNRNLGFKEADRIENIRRIAEVSKLMNDAGLIVLTSFISPHESERENAREIIGSAFRLVYVSTSLEVCESRDVKKLYAKARRGEIPNFTGISATYEIPGQPDLTIDTAECSVDEAVEMLMREFFDGY